MSISGDTLRYDGQVAIITGAGGGLGRSYAKLLASRGAKVVVNDIASRMDGGDGGDSAPEAVVDEIIAAGGVAIADRHRVDDEPGGIVTTALDAWGRIDVVVASAGIATGGTLEEAPRSAWQRNVDVALHGTVGLIKCAWPALAKTSGRVVTVASSSIFGQVHTAPYASSKAAVLVATRIAAEEGRTVGIRANCVLPMAHTRMTEAIPAEEFKSALRRDFPPDRAAAVVGWLAHESVSVSGEAFTIGGGRAARVFLGVTAGWGAGDSAPEDFRDHAAEILDLTDYVVPTNSMAEVAWAGRCLGIDLEGKWAPSLPSAVAVDGPSSPSD